MNAMERVAALAGATGAWSPSLSPDGTRLAYVTDRSGLPRLEVVALDGGPPRQLSGPDEEVVSVAWSPSWTESVGGQPGPGEWLTYLVAPDGLIRSELHAVRPDGRDHRVLDGAGEEETVFAGCWTARPGWYAYSVADGPGSQVRVVDVVSGRVVPVLDGGFLVVTSVAGDLSRMVVRRGERGRRHLLLVDVDLDVDGDDRAEPEGVAVPPRVRRLSDVVLAGGVPLDGEDGRIAGDGATVWARTSAGEEFTVLAAVDVDGAGAPGPVRVVARRAGCDLDAYAVLPGGSRALCVWNDGGPSLVEVVHLATGATVAAVPLPHEVISSWSLAADGTSFVAAVSGPRHPRQLWRVTLPSDVGGPPAHGRQPAPLVPAPAPIDVRTAEVSELARAVVPRRIHLTATDGTPLDAWLYRPADARDDTDPRPAPGPTVVTFHGGPESQERPAYSGLVQALVTTGMTVVAPNVRGSSGFGRSFVSADDGARRAEAVGDVVAVVDHLVRAGLAVPGRIGAHGWSYGGYLTLLALGRWPDLFAAGCAVAGMSDLRTFFRDTEPWMAAASTAEYGDPARASALLEELSPSTYLHRVQAPTLLVHGDRDTNVPVGESLRAHDALTARGVTTRLVLLPGEGHAVVGREGRVRLAEEVAAWFCRWL